MILVILFSFLILNCPITIWALLATFGNYANVFMNSVELFAMQFLLANSSINIFIYAIFTTDFRKTYLQMLHCNCKVQLGNESNEPTNEQRYVENT